MTPGGASPAALLGLPPRDVRGAADSDAARVLPNRITLLWGVQFMACKVFIDCVVLGADKLKHTPVNPGLSCIAGPVRGKLTSFMWGLGPPCNLTFQVGHFKVSWFSPTASHVFFPCEGSL